jgi:carboxypeptidase Taq
MKTSYLTPLFEKLKIDLKELLREIVAKPQFDESFLYRDCPHAQQLALCKAILQKMGFDEASSRLDLSVHPFCSTLHPKDVRMTTSIHPNNLFFAIFSTLHEGGHGLYNKGLPAEHFGSPLCEPISLGFDESQSRFWETLIGQSEPFWHYFFPILQRDFHAQFGSLSFENFYQAINAVKPTLIRIEADEVTYNLHIIVRFEIEKGLIEGSIRVKDVPAVWNEKMRECLGIAPPYDGEGCLQDIHWSLGFIGYFPTYTLGNLYAAQIFEAFSHAHPDWKEKVRHGNLDFVREWLTTHIHQYGRQFSSEEMCRKVTGRPLSEQPFIDYLNHKYRSLYQIK